jgi:FtsP/CotA-like multicopper oxidase with cupredoxin domain
VAPRLRITTRTRADAALSNGWVAPPVSASLPPADDPAAGRDVARPSAGAEAPAAQRVRAHARDGDTLELVAAPVRRTIDGRTETTLGFNGQYPGPLIDVPEGARVTVRFVNGTDWPTAIHWHGLRLENRFDGVPHLTQPLVDPGSSFDYRLTFPDPGVFWYHPHHHEDVLQDLGLHSNILVRPPRPRSRPAHRDEVLVLDDELVGEAGLVAWPRSPTRR